MSDNMKIGEKGLLGGQEALQQLKRKLSKDQSLASNRSDTAAGVDRVDLSLGQAINQLLDQEKAAEAKQARMARLKELIARQEYKPPIDQVARAVAEEITFEIATQANVVGTDE